MSKKHGRLASQTRGDIAADKLRFSTDAIHVTTEGVIAIDASKLEPPTNVYDADFAWVSYRRGAVSLFFAKEDLNGTNRLRTRLELRYPTEGFLEHFWKNSREFHQIVREYVQRLPEVRLEQRPLVESWESVKDHSEWVNYSYLARVGSQSALDFFNLAVPGIVQFTKGQGTSGLIMRPVARVLTTTADLCRLLDSCEALVVELQEAEALDA
jgi:hypothetical protein